MMSARMIVEMVQHDRALAEVLRPPGQRRHFFVQLLDQALLVRRDDIHDADH